MSAALVNGIAVLSWLFLGWIGGEYIIRWNKKHLLQSGNRSVDDVIAADKLNANLSLDRGTKVRTWRWILIVCGAITAIKAMFLFLHSLFAKEGKS